MLALARKYRPRKFSDVAVQDHVSNTLKNAIAAKRIAHGYLLSGPRGVGKTTLARVLAMALNCERGAPGGEPCGDCESCRRIWAGSTSLDVVEIDAASNRGVDDARELRERAMYAPSGDERYKVYIVDEAHMLTREAWNALLKILEEPPPRVVFVFATTEPQKIAQSAAPVLSRLQRFDFKRIGPAEIRARLDTVLRAEKVEADPDAVAMIARAADGSMRDALSLTDQVLAMGGSITPERAREALGLVPEDQYLELLQMIAEQRAADVFPYMARLADSGIDYGQFLAGLGEMIRAQLSVVLGGQPAEVSEQARRQLEARRDSFAAADLVRMLNAIGEMEVRFRRSGQQRLLVETLLVRFALFDRTAVIEDVLRAMGSDGKAGEQGSRDRAGPPAAKSGRGDPIRSEMVREATPPTTPRASLSVERGALAHDVTHSTRLRSPDLTAVTGRWDDLAQAMRSSGKALVAAALEASTPHAVNAAGELTVALDEPNDFHAKAIEQAAPDLLSVLGDWFQGLSRIAVYREGAAAPVERPKRVTDDMVKAERLNSLRRKNPALDAAIEALDLEIVE